MTMRNAAVAATTRTWEATLEQEKAEWSRRQRAAEESASATSSTAAAATAGAAEAAMAAAVRSAVEEERAKGEEAMKQALAKAHAEHSKALEQVCWHPCRLCVLLWRGGKGVQPRCCSSHGVCVTPPRHIHSAYSASSSR